MILLLLMAPSGFFFLLLLSLARYERRVLDVDTSGPAPSAPAGSFPTETGDVSPSRATDPWPLTPTANAVPVQRHLQVWRPTSPAR